MSGKSQQFVERKGTFLSRPSRCFHAKGNKFFFNTFQRLSPSNLPRGSKISFFLNWLDCFLYILFLLFVIRILAFFLFLLFLIKQFFSIPVRLSTHVLNLNGTFAMICKFPQRSTAVGRSKSGVWQREHVLS